MFNRYSPPRAPLEDHSEPPAYDAEYKLEKSAMRPLGVFLVVVLFGLFSLLGAALLILERDWWVVGHIALTGLLVYWFRRLWWGDDADRKVAVFVGFLIGAISFLGGPEGSIQTWSVSDLASFAEGCYFFLAACYLVYARKNPFFKGQNAF